jgi:hypothetical protein
VITAAELDALIEELTVDAYNDEEQLSGFLVGAEEALVRGEQPTIAGVRCSPGSDCAGALGRMSGHGTGGHVRAGSDLCRGRPLVLNALGVPPDDETPTARWSPMPIAGCSSPPGR